MLRTPPCCDHPWFFRPSALISAILMKRPRWFSCNNSKYTWLGTTQRFLRLQYKQRSPHGRCAGGSRLPTKPSHLFYPPPPTPSIHLSFRAQVTQSEAFFGRFCLYSLGFTNPDCQITKYPAMVITYNKRTMESNRYIFTPFTNNFVLSPPPKK